MYFQKTFSSDGILIGTEPPVQLSAHYQEQERNKLSQNLRRLGDHTTSGVQGVQGEVVLQREARSSPRSVQDPDVCSSEGSEKRTRPSRSPTVRFDYIRGFYPGCMGEFSLDEKQH